MIYILLICLIGICLLLYMVKEAFENNVLKQDFAFSAFPYMDKPLRIFFISDIHRRAINPVIIEESKGKADLVIIGGDLLEKKVPMDRVKQNLLKLKKIGPVFFVWGNNDYDVREDELISLFRELGIRMIRNSSFYLSSPYEKIAILGIDDIAEEREDLEQAMKDTKDAPFKILISHNPVIMEELSEEHQIQLVLSGHTHGGQVHILGYSPYKKGGIRKQKGIMQLISNGYGTSHLPIRLGAKPECHLITIKKP